MMPDYAQLMREGVSRLEAGDLSGADDLFSNAQSLNPRDFQVWLLRATVALRLAEPEAALMFASRARELARHNVDVLKLLGVAHAEKGELDDAIACFRRALKLRPASAEILYNLAKSLRNRGDDEAAMQTYRRVLALDPEDSAAVVNYAKLLREHAKVAEALPLLERTCERLPHDDVVALERINAFAELHGVEHGIKACRERLAAHPQDRLARSTLGELLLGTGSLREGWRKYLSRPSAGAMDGRMLVPFADDIGAEQVALEAEGGLGDVLFFLRFARALSARGARLVFDPPAKLRSILSRVDFVRLAMAPEALAGKGIKGFRRVLLGDLPALVDSDRPEPPLAFDALGERLERWRSRLSALGPGPYIGVTWRAGTARAAFPEFALPFRLLSKQIDSAQLGAALATLPGTVLVLQRRPTAAESERFAAALGRIAHDLSALNDDLEDMLAVLRLLDEYVGVSNTNMHLLAGFGGRARTLLPYPPEYRWMCAGATSPWFPGFRTYRQAPGGNWETALTALVRDMSG